MWYSETSTPQHKQCELCKASSFWTVKWYVPISTLLNSPSSNHSTHYRKSPTPKAVPTSSPASLATTTPQPNPSPNSQNKPLLPSLALTPLHHPLVLLLRCLQFLLLSLPVGLLRYRLHQRPHRLRYHNLRKQLV